MSMNNAQQWKPRKNYLVALLLSIFLGTLAIDRFYLGHISLAIGKLLLGWLTFGVWWIIDIILIAMRKVDSSGFVWDDEVPMAPYQPYAPYPPQHP